MVEATPILHGIAAIIWPIIIGVLVWRLFPLVKGIVSSRGFTVKFGGVEVSVQDATEKFQTQLNDLNEQVGALRSSIPGLPVSASATSASLAAAAVRTRARSATILWVDDKPEGNALEVAQLSERGINIAQAHSTAEAMAVLGDRADFAAVVSDMGRTEDGEFRPRAGLELLEAMASSNILLPFFVYTGRRSAIAHHGTIMEKGGDGATASTIELFEWIERQTRRKI